MGMGVEVEGSRRWREDRMAVPTLSLSMVGRALEPP
jgi:hypothetical protein